MSPCFSLYLHPNDPWHTTSDHSRDIFINPYNLSMSTRWASCKWAKSEVFGYVVTNNHGKVRTSLGLPSMMPGNTGAAPMPGGGYKASEPASGCQPPIQGSKCDGMPFRCVVFGFETRCPGSPLGYSCSRLPPRPPLAFALPSRQTRAGWFSSLLKTSWTSCGCTTRASYWAVYQLGHFPTPIL